MQAGTKAAYPKILDALDRFGVKRKISSFVMPMGYSFLRKLPGSGVSLDLPMSPQLETIVQRVPEPAPTESHFLMTLTPDGSRILVLRKTYNNTSHTTLVSQAIDVYSATALVSGTTDFVKTGSLPITTDASVCTSGSDDCYYGNQYLLPSVDSNTLFWIGNQNMQVFSIP